MSNDLKATPPAAQPAAPGSSSSSGPSGSPQAGAAQKALTDRQQQAYDLRQAGKSRAEAAVAMGLISETTISVLIYPNPRNGDGEIVRSWSLINRGG